MTRVLLGLGSNVGDRRAHLRQAVCVMEGWPQTRVTAVTGLYETHYLGPGEDQSPYLNACVDLLTSLPAEELLERGKDAERRAGRRPGSHMAPRPLDVDVLVYGENSHHSRRLEVPHPRMGHRRFVLEPLAEVAEELVPPGWRFTIAEQLKRPALQGQHVQRVDDAGWWERSQ